MLIHQITVKMQAVRPRGNVTKRAKDSIYMHSPCFSIYTIVIGTSKLEAPAGGP